MKLNKQAINFTQVSNFVLSDKNLSAKAKWLYAYLYSKPDDWDFAVNRIKEEFTDWRDSITAWLRELEKFWYLVRKRLSNGKFEYLIWFDLLKKPNTENPEMATDPITENPKMGKSQSGKIRQLSNIENTSNTKNTSNTEYIAHFFEKFWNLYPKKVSKVRSKKIFEKLLKAWKTDAEKILAGAQKYAEECEIKQKQKQYILNPDTFLNNERWLDEFDLTAENGGYWWAQEKQDWWERASGIEELDVNAFLKWEI